MVKRGDKRGVMTSAELGWLVLAAALVIIIILAISGAFGSLSNLFKKTNVDITLISQKCEQLASMQSPGFCSDRIEISKNTYVNCPYAIKNLGANITSETPKCNSATGAKAICEKLKLEMGKRYIAAKINVNEKTCEEWGVVQATKQK